MMEILNGLKQHLLYEWGGGRMKVRIITHVNYTEYADVEVKDETELDEMHENGIYDNAEWIHGKDYGETYHEILDEENNNE